VQVTGDETWDLFMNVEAKGQWEQWMHTHSPNKLISFKETLSGRRLMATVFWDRKGLLLVEFMQWETTITSKVYCKTLRNCVGSFRTDTVVLLHDGARLHTRTAARTQALLEHFS
jgi:hypothetical protein